MHPLPPVPNGTPLALLRDRLPDVRAGAGKAAGVPTALTHRLLAAAPLAALRDVGGQFVQQVGTVAVVPLYGFVTQKPNAFTRFGWMTAAEDFVRVNELLAADNGVSAIVWDVDSPGGSVFGLPEAADKQMSLRGRKKVYAVANPLMASAAYWLACCADKVFASPSSLTGSIGVYIVHDDCSKANELAGVKPTYITAGKYKADGNPDEPLSDSARASMQASVDGTYGMFVTAVAKARGVTPAKVRGGFGEGDVLPAGRAVAEGLADKVASLADVLAFLKAVPPDNPAMARAAARQRHAESK